MGMMSELSILIEEAWEHPTIQKMFKNGWMDEQDLEAGATEAFAKNLNSVSIEDVLSETLRLTINKYGHSRVL